MRTTSSVLVALALFRGAFAEAPLPQTFDVPMHDGTLLKTDVYLPAAGNASWPVILYRSPYPRAGIKDVAKHLNEAGYAVAVQDTRGTGDSGGIFTGFLDDGWGTNKDGVETVDWVLKQPWCNGRIGTDGGSAAANTQALLAPATNHLACQVMEAGACDFYRDLAYPGGVWRVEQTDAWFKMFKDPGERARQTLRAHPTYDGLWAGLDVLARAGDITAPGLHIGGWFDIFKEGTLEAFVSRQYHGGRGAKGNQKLIMKWTGHGVYQADLDLKFPKNVDDVRISQVRSRFTAHWLKAEDNGIESEPPVQYYVIGDDTQESAPGVEWRTANRWPPFPPRERSVYLFGDSLQDTPPEQFVTRSFTYDPANPCPTKGGCNLTVPFGPYDQREVLDRKDILLFKGPVLKEPLETTGAVKVKLYVSTDSPDTDFTAKLIDVYPPGDDRDILVLESIHRLKFREGFEKAAPPVKPDEIVPLEIDLGSTSWIFNTGHRLALAISSSNYPHFEVNPNTGDDFPNKDTMHPANNSVHSGPEKPSALVIPIRLPEIDSDSDGVTDEAEWNSGTDLHDPRSK